MKIQNNPFFFSFKKILFRLSNNYKKKHYGWYKRKEHFGMHPTLSKTDAVNYPGLTCGFNIVKPRLFKTVDLWSYTNA